MYQPFANRRTNSYLNGFLWTVVVILLGTSAYGTAYMIVIHIQNVSYDWMRLFQDSVLISVTFTLSCAIYIEFMFSGFSTSNKLVYVALYFTLFANFLLTLIVMLGSVLQIDMVKDIVFVSSITILFVTFIYSFYFRSMLFHYEP